MVAENDLAVAFPDGFPVSRGHTLIVPRRHVATWFDASPEERQALLALADEVKARCDAELRPDGYNLGLNVGAAAGQTVDHLHLHLIPRFRGDVDDPTGGVRYVIPDKGNYRRPGFVARSTGERAEGRAPPLAGDLDDPFLDHLVPLFGRAERVSILAAFVTDGGVEKIEPSLDSALDRGASVRILCGDYLDFTRPTALRRLLDIAGAATAADRGALEVKVVEVASIEGRAFHPKSWIFEAGHGGSAFVGSSNLSDSALGFGVEWNLRLDAARDPEGFRRLLEAFDTWWQRARRVDLPWIEAYEARVAATQGPGPTPEPPPEPPGHTRGPEPRDVQLEALAELRAARRQGRERALVVMATGLGKTWLAAFDVAQMGEEIGRPPRVLFVAHRAEILRQSAATFRRLRPEAAFSWCMGTAGDLSGDVVFASVQKLARPRVLERLASDGFDYVIIDEVHHAAAETYRRVLDRLHARFLLGLTATPERADAGDIYGLFDDFVAYRADLGVGIERGHLVPFHYWGLKDTIDYRPIPWRNGRFDTEALANAAATRARMERLWEAWQAHPADRSLVFCCSIRHAEFTAGWLRERGVEAVAVHSGPGSADRAESLKRLEAGRLQAVCTVDLFNEGIDVPQVDRVVMLRPTESPVIFLQQLGRGLRTAPGKEALEVIDFVGNHRVFLDRMRTLLSLVELGDKGGLRRFLERGRPDDLIAGCSVEVELEAVDLLRKLLPTGGARQALVQAYRELKAARGARPTVGELFRMGYNPKSLKKLGGWFSFVDKEGDLTSEERAALEDAADWLFDLEAREAMTRCFKMVTLEALLDADALTTGMAIPELARRSYEILKRSPELFRDLEGVKVLGDPHHVPEEVWLRYWIKNPLAHWSGATGRKGRAWFEIEGDRFLPRFRVRPEAERALARMTRELVEYRLAQYRERRRVAEAKEAASFEAAVVVAGHDPVLRLPDRTQHPEIPSGNVDVRLEDGTFWRFRFLTGAVAQAHPVGTAANRLPDLLRRWFGPTVGAPGTAFRVRFHRQHGDWHVEPVVREEAAPIPTPRPGAIVCFPDLRAAAGWDGDELAEGGFEHEEVILPGHGNRDEVFAVRASGRSMEGWRSTIHDGDWLVLRWARGQEMPTLKGRVVLVARGDPMEGQSYHLKRVTKTPSGYVLRSDNPDVPDRPAEPGDHVVAVLERVVRPEELAPDPGTVVPEGEIGAAFGLPENPTAPWSRCCGHLFFLVDDAAHAPLPTVPPHPGETAYVLTRELDGRWRYQGIARWEDDQARWRLEPPSETRPRG
ncbi:MAG: HIT domain-containing protein [Nitrospirae bacterium]|nr:MAG: HIT domain-containing protein [Nitrospirota bacterium]